MKIIYKIINFLLLFVISIKLIINDIHLYQNHFL